MNDQLCLPVLVVGLGDAAKPVVCELREQMPSATIACFPDLGRHEALTQIVAAERAEASMLRFLVGDDPHQLIRLADIVGPSRAHLDSEQPTLWSMSG